MKSFLNFKQGTEFKAGKKLVLFLLVFSFLAVFTWKYAGAQVVTDPLTEINTGLISINTSNIFAQDTASAVKLTWWQKITKSIQKAGSLAFQRVLSSALNKIAYDSANYIGSGGAGQKPLFITQSLGDYLTQIGDEAAGQFIESFVNNLNTPVNEQCSSQLKSCREGCFWLTDMTQLTLCQTDCDKAATRCAAQNGSTVNQVTPSFNVCSPSSLEAKIKIGLGLVDQTRPVAPNCTGSQIIKDWGDSIDKKVASLRDKNYLDEFVNIFDPRANDVGIFMTAQADALGAVTVKQNNANTNFITNKGWTDVRDISGALQGIPGEAQRAANSAAEARQQALGKTTGDILVDAANVFLNQLYISAFNNLLQNLAKKTSDANVNSITYPDAGVGANVGITNLKETTNTLLQPNFGVRADYDILSELSICIDPKNPGPTNCVIDDKFLQGITEKKTVAEAIKEGYLHGDWQLTIDSRVDSYNLRNLSILREYRILPIGWEEAATRAYADLTNPKKATLMDYISCFDTNDQYNTFSNAFNVNDQGWCQGLVDPNWVLKAPLNYCSKEGFGAQILSTSVIPGSKGTGGVANTLSQLSVARADSYCADNQTCIKEKSDGSCDAYGYCDEERRTWVFGSDSCQPINNTCQSFTNTDNGTSVAYLENTLNYDSCTSENSGCRQYSFNGTYATSIDTVSWDAGKSVYLNKNSVVCDSSDGGCTEMMRLKPTWGSNLVMNSDFHNDEIGQNHIAPALNDWPVNNARATIVDSASTPGNSTGKALRLDAMASLGGIFSTPSASLLPANFQTISGQSYTLSADVYLQKGESVRVSLGAASEGFVKNVTTHNSWQHVTITRVADSAYNDASFFINGYSPYNDFVFYLKNLKFEISGWDTGYTAYGKYAINEKLLPAYLEKSCYTDATSATKDYSLKSDAPAVCSNFARKCNKEEAGCELYSSVTDNFAVPAKVVSSDYCSDQCIGYDAYVAKASLFNPAVSENLIPKTATVCSAAASGCNEFTNLDTLAAGGEQKEYYTALKQCVKPSAATCSTFYSWEGTENGYQLKSYSLKSTNGLPDVTAADNTLCNATIYNLPITDASYNADCREFYNAAGQVSYHLMTRTITCSDNCHAYRLSDKNVVKNMTATQCIGADKHWNAADSSCNVCPNGGVWDINNGACVYQAIPAEGQTCSASQSGCREYNGNSGNNVRLVTSYDFESGPAQYWTSNCSNGLSVSSIANNKDGHSLQYTNSAINCEAVGQDSGSDHNAIARTRLIERILASDNVAAQLAVGTSVNQGSAYTVKFLARAATDVHVKIYFLNRDTGARAYFNASSTLLVKGGNEWNVYQANLDNLDHAVSANERLIITADADFLFDDFVLSEITDRYYLIKNSSQIPDVCYYDIFDNYQGADYNLGCAQYADRGNLQHNLRQFSKLCSSSSVGCEQMIDTKNYSPYGSGIWNDTNGNNNCDPIETDCVKVPGDSVFYAIYDPNKLCSSSAKGCSRLGQGQGGAIITSWIDVYKKNDPNTYDQTLCQKDNVGCEEWQSGDNSFSYFKNPGSNACSYRASSDPTIAGKTWYKVAVKRCDADDSGVISGTEKDGAICISDNDCGTHACIIDNNDYPCSVSTYKTIGLGGAGNQVPVPDTAAGLCSANESGCTEYIDPVSQFSANLVYNPNYQTINGVKDGWGFTGEYFNNQKPTDTQQIIKLEQNKLYSLTTKYSDSGAGNVSLAFVKGVKPLLVDNTLGTTTNTITITNGANQPIIFNSLSNYSTLLSGGTVNKTIEIKELIIDYQLKSNVDKTGCNGLVQTDNGCVLFNERSIVGPSGLASLAQGWDAYKTSSGSTPTLCNTAVPGSCTANQLIKVRPDRVCSKWLDCVTYIKDPVTKEETCYAVAECNRLDDKNECANFIIDDNSARSFDINNDKNATGYSLLNKYHFSQIKEVGIDSDAHYDFENDPALSCRRDVDASGTGECVFNNASNNINEATLVREPENAPTDYPAHGKVYLRVPAPYQISMSGSTDDLINLESPAIGETNTYYLSYMVNTRNSGLRAKAIITDADNAVMKDARTGESLIFYASADSGWETKIVKFNIGQNKNQIKIYLTSDTTDPKDAHFVYFDNVNIEPVLEIGPDQYASRECRLYPTEDSLTCTNKYNNVISNGLEGYCLEHDSYNQNVCLMWYPVDRISTTKILYQSASSYQGPYPLNYCTEANGNFDIVEKRVGAKLQDGDAGDRWDTNCEIITSGEACAECPGGSCENYYVLGNNNGDYDVGGCFPKPEKLLPGTTVQRTYQDLGIPCRSNSPSGATYLDGWAPYDGQDSSICANYPCAVWRDDNTLIGNIDVNTKVQDDSFNSNPPYRIYNYDAIPNTEDDLSYISNTSEPDKVFRLTCNQFTQVVDGEGNNKAWTNRVSSNTSYPTTTPRFFVYKSSLDNTESHYGSYDAAGNPDVSLYNLANYGRNNATVPFGAATWPDTYDLITGGPVRLRNIYSSQNNETVLAGRPYGCADGIGGGCSVMGYCNNDVNAYCLTSYNIDNNAGNAKNYISAQTCSNGGTCLPLWKQPLSDSALLNQKPDYENILRTLFLKSYNNYSFQYGMYKPGAYIYPDYTTIPPASATSDFNSSGCARVGEGLSSFCAVFPTLKNINMYYGDTKTIIAIVISATTDLTFQIPSKGVYRLEFNSDVDSEQQPLKKVVIDWGDGNTQTITGEDEHPNIANPHVFYHYYGSSGAKQIKIKITDNWGFYKEN